MFSFQTQTAHIVVHLPKKLHTFSVLHVGSITSATRVGWYSSIGVFNNCNNALTRASVVRSRLLASTDVFTSSDAL